MTLLSRRLVPVRRSDDSGFTLVESVVALFIAGMIFSALAGVLVTAVKASVFGRQNQQATDLMIQRIEELRRADFGALGHATLASDTRLTPCAAGQCLAVEVGGSTVQEPVLQVPSGILPTQSKTIAGSSTNETTYQMDTYVTSVAGTPTKQLKRVTVFVRWQSGGKERFRSQSTLVAYTQRGLPLPVFKLNIPTNTVTVNPGARVTFHLTLANQGAPDRWNLDLGGTGAGDGWTLVRDVDADGNYDETTDVALTDTTGDGIVDTDRVDPGETVGFFLTRDTAAAEALSTRATTVTATSVGQPTASGAAQTVTATTVLVSGAVPLPSPSPSPSPTEPAPDPGPADCLPTSTSAASRPSNSFSLRQYSMHNDPAGHTDAQTQLYLSQGAPDEPWLRRYSNDLDSVRTGRVVVPTSTTAPSDAAVLALADRSTFADWAVQMGSRTELGGTAVVRLWVARADAGTSPVALKTVLYTATGASTGLTRTAKVQSTVSLASLPCAGFQEVYVSLSVPSSTIVPKNEWFGLRVVPVGSDRVRIGYDVPSGTDRPYPSALTIAAK